MKTNGMKKMGLYIGAGAGLMLFAVAGLLPGSVIGGMIGINIAGSLFGLPLEATMLARLIVAASMILGVCMSGAVIVTATSSLGWLMGNVAETLMSGRAVAAEAGSR
ncbi:MAG: hypothetical protein HZB31_05175 [Nitrospirae bacterium]|nr:hypothetical protein [Nitrospirota bacterium]